MIFSYNILLAFFLVLFSPKTLFLFVHFCAHSQDCLRKLFSFFCGTKVATKIIYKKIHEFSNMKMIQWPEKLIKHYHKSHIFLKDVCSFIVHCFNRMKLKKKYSFDYMEFVYFWNYRRKVRLCFLIAFLANELWWFQFNFVLLKAFIGFERNWKMHCVRRIVLVKTKFWNWARNCMNFREI